MPIFRTMPLVLALLVAGCSNPADDKVKVAATAPQPVENPVKAPDAPASASSVPAPASSASALTFSGAGSKIDFVGSKVGGSHKGGFKTFSGTAELASDKPEPSAIAVTIDTASLWADDEKLTGHLKSPDFFDVAKFPKSEFVSTAIKEGGEKGASHTITGNLTLHGVTKSISIPATVQVADGVLTLTSEFAINRKDFGVKSAGAQDSLIRDEVVIKLAVKTAQKS